MKTILKQIGWYLRELFNLLFKQKYIFENGYYMLETEDGWSMYRPDGTLLIDKFFKKHVYANGWYKLEATDRVALYREDGSLVADNLKCCDVYADGSYMLTTEDDITTVYQADGSPAVE